jgi:hypothetical protein
MDDEIEVAGTTCRNSTSGTNSRVDSEITQRQTHRATDLMDTEVEVEFTAKGDHSHPKITQWKIHGMSQSKIHPISDDFLTTFQDLQFQMRTLNLEVPSI